jgi:hypothetical protein
LGLLGLQSLARRDPGNQAIVELLPKDSLIAPDQQAAMIDNAQKPAALVRFTFLDSLRKLVGATGSAVTPPAQP